jgi:hypothetical protein
MVPINPRATIIVRGRRENCNSLAIFIIRCTTINGSSVSLLSPGSGSWSSEFSGLASSGVSDQE